MPRRTPRRLFLVQSGRTALGLSLLPLAACSRRPDTRPEPQEDATAALTTELEAQIPSLLAAARVPGLSIAIVRDARVVWSRGFGVKNTVSKTPVDEDTLFEAGSVSKTVFAYAVMKLYETGLLDLDRPLTQYTTVRWIKDDPRTSRDEMIRPQVKADGPASWALGWQILHQKKGNLLSHGGDNPGFKSFVLASAERKSGYVILTNGDNGGEAIGKLASGDTPLNESVNFEFVAG